MAYNKAPVLLGLGTLLTVTVLAQSASAKDNPPPPPPCPLTAQLRVADAASLAGLMSLSQCAGSVTIAPASPAEEMPRPDLRITPPEGERLKQRDASMAFAVADAGSTPRTRPASVTASAKGPMKVAAIAPAKDEPMPAATVLPSEAAAILAMRPVSYTTPHDAMITRVAARHRIDPLLLHAVIDQESRYRANATSPVGARGLMQLMPGTAAMLNVRGAAIVDAEANVDGGARLIRRLHGKYNDFNLTLAAYNAGEGAVRKYGGIPPYAETRNYVRGVMARYSKLVSEQGAGAR